MNSLIKSEVRKCLAAIADEVMENICDVNAGGCGVYAVELAKRMKRLGIEGVKIRVYSYRREGKLPNVTTVERKTFNNIPPEYNSDWASNGVWFCHVRMEWDGRLWDAEGDVPVRGSKFWNDCCEKHPGEVSIEALNLLCGKQVNWNRSFDRATGIPAMREIMNRHFLKLKAFMVSEQVLLAA